MSALCLVTFFTLMSILSDTTTLLFSGCHLFEVSFSTLSICAIFVLSAEMYPLETVHCEFYFLIQWAILCLFNGALRSFIFSVIIDIRGFPMASWPLFAVAQLLFPCSCVSVCYLVWWYFLIFTCISYCLCFVSEFYICVWVCFLLSLYNKMFVNTVVLFLLHTLSLDSTVKIQTFTHCPFVF